MGILDKAIAAITPEASDDDKMKARAKARAAATPGSWLSMVLDQHEAIEGSFAAVKAAKTADQRRAEQEQLGLLLTGHSIAEEVVLYPAMANGDQKGHASEAYTEQSAAKVQTAALDDLDPMSQDYLDKLEHLRAAVSHHVYEEENEWFPELAKTTAKKQAKLTQLFTEHFDRYGKAA